jgi:hypothetical protein
MVLKRVKRAGGGGGGGGGRRGEFRRLLVVDWRIHIHIFVHTLLKGASCMCGGEGIMVWVETGGGWGRGAKVGS